MGLLTNVRSVLYRVFFGERGHSEESKPYRDLSMLIREAEFRKGEPPFCPYCFLSDSVMVMMEFRHSTLAGGDGSPLREDQTWKCPECRCTQNFGLPLTRDEFNRLRGERNGKYLNRPTFRRDERNREDVRERLRELGYLDFES